MTTMRDRADRQAAYWRAKADELAVGAGDVPIDPAYLHAWHEVGYLITADNAHLLSVPEIRAYHDAVNRHRAEIASEDHKEQVKVLVDEAADSLERVVASMLRDHDPDAADDFMTGILADERDEQAAEFTLSVLLGVAAGWLVAARDSGVDPSGALNWIKARLGNDPAIAAYQISRFVGHIGAPEFTVRGERDWLQHELFPAMVWLAAGVAATAGGGDAYWLRQFDVSPSAS